MLSRFFLLFFILYSLFSLPVFAQDKDLIINGENVSYSEEKGIVEAYGSVEVVYKDVRLFGQHVIYNARTEKVYADQGFDLHYNGIKISGETLDYGLKNKIGKASDIYFEFDGTLLWGREINFDAEKFDLKDSFFTSCDLAYPHYHVTAREITLYPKYGWLVAYWGFFWLGQFPVVPMPTYIFDIRASAKEKKNLPPFPEISSNDEDGLFINERLAWHIRRELSGTYSLNYAGKKGFGGGGEADYLLDDNNRGTFRIYGNFVNGMWGGLNHYRYFGKETQEKIRGPFVFFELPVERQYELETTLSYRERINYQRVSYLPNLAIRGKKSEIMREEAKYDAEIELGMVKEENNIRLLRGGGKFKFYWDFPETKIGNITPSLSLDNSYYSNGGRWTKTQAGLDLVKIYSESLSLGLGYKHYLGLEGQSPFNFEMYRFSPSDRLTSDVFFVIGETGARVATSYFTNTWQPEDIDYTLFFKLHCYNLLVQYRSLRGEFGLGFSLRES